MQLGDAQWLAAWVAAINDDAELKIVGKWLDVRLSITIGDRRNMLVFRGGRVERTVSAFRIDDWSDVGFRAPLEVWEKYMSPLPPPLHHDLFAMIMRVPAFVVEGNSMTFAQNARAIHRVMKIMKGVKA